MQVNNKTIHVFDNEGETFDRFTILLANNGDMWGASERPFNPQGFGMYVGNATENQLKDEKCHNWRIYCKLKHCIRRSIRLFLKEAKTNTSWMGKEVTEPAELPEDVVKFINQIVS